MEEKTLLEKLKEKRARMVKFRFLHSCMVSAIKKHLSSLPVFQGVSLECYHLAFL